MNPAPLALLFVALGASVAAQADKRDIITPKSGKKIACRVVLELDDEITYLIGTREKKIARKKVNGVHSVQRSLRTILTTFDKAEDKPDAMLALAGACESAELPEMARLFHWKVLMLDPNHKKANAALGHKLHGKEWRVPVDGTWRRLDLAEKVRADWGKAWRLRSEHFEVRTDAGMPTAVRTLLELESYVRHVYDLFQKDLELKLLTFPLQVHVYRDKDQFPRLSNNVDAYFNPNDNVLYTFLDDNKRPLELFHTVTHMLVGNLGGRGRARRNDLPGWLNEGLADYFEGILEPTKGGRVKLDLARRVGYRIGNLSNEKKPYSLRRVLNFKEADFMASSKQKLKYAQSYALTLYLMEADKQKHLDDFLQFTKKALIGKASSSTFRQMFKKHLKAIEKNHLKMK